jgi:hypothetical protein
MYSQNVGAADRGDDGGGADARFVVDERGQVVREVDAGGETANRYTLPPV